MKKRKGDDWFPFWIDKWIFGSTRDELTVEQCAVWVDFLALSYKDDGYIRANEGIPYPIKRLSGLLNRSEELIQQTINRCLEKKVNKLRLQPDGTLYVISHPEYELSGRHKRRLNEGDEGPEEDEIFNKIAIKCPDSFLDMANKSGTVRVSRLIIAIMIGRSLKPEEEAHHRNKKEYDNWPKNLMLFKNHADHTRYEHGKRVVPIWDGLDIDDKTAIIAIKTATKTRIEKSRIEKKRLDKIKKEKAEKILGKEFEDFWKFYYQMGNKEDDPGDKQDAKKAYNILRVTASKAEIIKSSNGYSGFLKHKEIKEGFKQKKMYASTFLRSKKWKRFLDFEYKPPL